MTKKDLPSDLTLIIKTSHKDLIAYEIREHFGEKPPFRYFAPILGEPRSGRILSVVQYTEEFVAFPYFFNAGALAEDLDTLRLSARYEEKTLSSRNNKRGWSLWSGTLKHKPILVAWADLVLS